MTKIDSGRLGVWRRGDELDPALAKDIEDLGYGTIWIGSSPSGDLKTAERLLAATDRIVIATGIVNMWASRADEVVDATIAHGDPAAVAARLTEHLDAGADHVAAHPLTEPGGDPRPALRAIVEALPSR
ncbi:hypothetical protein [Actinomadura meridiana]